ncbi:hypothetical protein HK101_009783 [Irineochytrium annulatum]|nr:hypothetical protein HK101_009783 [Irineochytrium annulatum]
MALARVPRIGDNSKNRSSDIFNFGGALGFDSGEYHHLKSSSRTDFDIPFITVQERYITNVAKEEKAKRQADRDYRKKRHDVKRQWRSDMETARWDRMAEDYARQEEQWQRRHDSSKMGSNSVSYNPITLQYHASAAGQKLAQEDAKTLYRTAMRSAHLYLKNNTFDPLRCQDIPRRLVADISRDDSIRPPSAAPAPAAEPTEVQRVPRGDRKTCPPTEMRRQPAAPRREQRRADIPTQLVSVVAHTAMLVKDRVKDDQVEKILTFGSRRAGGVSSGGGGGGSGSASDSTENAKGAGIKSIAVEVGSGRPHNWSRHF